MEKNKEESVRTLTPISWYPGHMAKTKRLIKERISLIDIVFELIDARIPISSKIKDLDEIIKDKPKILVVTKYDLCDKVVTDKILQKYTKQGYKVLATDLINGNNIKDIITISKDLMKNIQQKRLLKGLKPRNIRAVVIGIPNVGKSTLINKLVGKKATNVGNRPGITKELNWIRIHPEIQLLDSPGILWPKLDNNVQAYNLASLTAIKEEILDLEHIVSYIINTMNTLYPGNLNKRYNLTEDDLNDIEQTYEAIAKRVGAYKKGSEIDTDKVEKTIINDLKEGRLGQITFDRLS
ncbi:MAG: ribosome biogenesis GTPase YlqF [Tenericutes bacterium]|nr:ribosome biogenesis GTPase YlqF [Mycoplasmatota bacterium]